MSTVPVRASNEIANELAIEIIKLFGSDTMPEEVAKNPATQLHALLLAASKIGHALRADRIQLLENFRRIIGAPIDVRDEVALSALQLKKNPHNGVAQVSYNVALNKYEFAMRDYPEEKRIVTP